MKTEVTSTAGGNAGAATGPTSSTAPASATEVGFVDGSGNLQPFSGTSTATGPKVTVTNFPVTQPVSGTVTANQGTGGASAWKVDGSAVTQPVSAVSLPLPAGASTSALQTTGNTSVASIDVKTPALGQALAAASVPVVLTAAQITTLTPLSSVTVTQATGTNLHTVVDSSALPTGAATSANQTTGNTSLSTIATNTGNIPAKGQATMANSTPVTIASDQPALSVTASPTKGTLTDGSGTTSATPSTATTLVASNASRKYLFIQNCSSSATIWINFTTTAVASQPSLPLLPFAAFVMETGFVTTEAISVISTTASAPLVVKQA